MIVKTAALVEQFSFWRVQVFGIVIRVHRPPTKADTTALGISDWEDDAVAESIIRALALVRRLCQPRRQNQLILNTLSG